MGPSLLPPLIVVLAINAASALSLVAGGCGLFIGIWGAIIVLAIYDWLGRKPCTFTLRSGDIAAVKCEGRIVNLRLARRSVRRLKWLRFIVSASFADNFFGEFERRFPGLLPKAYRDALQTRAR